MNGGEAMTHKEAKGIINKTRLTPASHDEWETVKKLLDRKPELVTCMNALDPSYPAERPQGAAAHIRNREILELMLERGVEMDIFMACALDRAEVVKQFVDQDPSLVHARGSHKIPLLMHVAGIESARVLVERGADVNGYQEKRRGPLHHAVRLGNREVVELLLEHGADVNMTGLGYGMEGLTPLEIAEERGDGPIAELLRRHGARTLRELTPG
jgi:ankyrin repeat protein